MSFSSTNSQAHLPDVMTIGALPLALARNVDAEPLDALSAMVFFSVSVTDGVCMK